MASIIDSLRSIFMDITSYFKIGVFTVPLYVSVWLFYNSGKDMALFYTVATTTILLLLGLVIKITGNVINQEDPCIQFFNPLKLLFSSIKGILAVGPIFLVCYFAANCLVNFININDTFNIIFKSLIWLIASVIILSSLMKFCEKEKIVDAYKLKTVLSSAGDLIASGLFFILGTVLFNVVLALLIGYTIFVVFGIGEIFKFFISYIVVVNLSLIADGLGQMYLDHAAFLTKN